VRDAAKEFTRQARAAARLNVLNLRRPLFILSSSRPAGRRALGASEREAAGGRVRTGGGLSELAAGVGLAASWGCSCESAAIRDSTVASRARGLDNTIPNYNNHRHTRNTKPALIRD